MRYFVIPARAGSKAILDKNLVDLGGHPLVAWTIHAAKEAAKSYDGARVYVTSEDRKILDVAESYGAVPHLRPPHLADDQASMVGVLRDFFRMHEDAHEVVLLYPTCPFRMASTIKNAIAAFESGPLHAEHESLMSVTAFNGRPYGGVMIVNGKLEYAESAEAFYRKQDTPKLYHANGAIFILRRGVLDKLNTQLFCKETVPYEIYGIEPLDIDTPFDLEVARAWVASGRAKLALKDTFTVAEGIETMGHAP
ncbi:MAG: acylneuraminate cytidylyltransferase family protein [Sphingomonadales bacterium]|nr:acylneuraminate cytidylyltransferase family protein [Sphingomonadaceae bacterium]MBS3930426.1 acylneuraminate cytidylyltransferase family protein [Sphingomonadales bacterium]